MQAMKDWHKSHPQLFVKTPRNRPGRDSYCVPGVNNLGKFGRWAFAEFTAVYEMVAEIAAMIENMLSLEVAK